MAIRKSKHYFGKRRQQFPKRMRFGQLTTADGFVWIVPRMLREWYSLRSACHTENGILKIQMNSVHGAMAGEMIGPEHYQQHLQRRKKAASGSAGQLTTAQMKELLHAHAA